MRTPLKTPKTTDYNWVNSVPDWVRFLDENPTWYKGWNSPPPRKERIEGCAWGYDETDE